MSYNTSFLLYFALFSFFAAADADPSSDCDDASEQSEPHRWVQDGGFLLLFIGVSAMFWGLALVCEEYFVPALNVLCEELNVPDDVAGATFMAAGASSPELFTSFIALFINHSAIGVGTVVGSEIFNHMIICSGSVLFSSTGVLQLDKWTFTRDVMFYFLSLVVLIWALKGNFFTAISDMFKASTRDECLEVTIFHATGLVVLYTMYAFVSGSFQSILKYLCGALKLQTPEQQDEPIRNVLTEPSADEVRQLQEADADRIARVLAGMLGSGDAAVDSQVATKSHSIRSMTLKKSVQYQRSIKYHIKCSKSIREGVAEDEQSNLVDWSHRRSTFVQDAPMYTWRSSSLYLPNIEDEGMDGIVNIVTTPIHKNRNCCARNKTDKRDEYVTMAMSPKHLSAYLQRCDTFYGLPVWNYRYYTVDYLGFHSRKALSSPIRGPHIEKIDNNDVLSVDITDKDNGQFQLLRRGGEKLLFRASSVEIMTFFVARLEAYIDKMRQKSQYERDAFVRTSSRELQNGIGCPELEDVVRDFRMELDGERPSDHNEGATHGCLLDVPIIESGDVWGPLKLVIHFGLFPLKYMLYSTLPIVHGKEGRQKYIGCIAVSILWLAALSFVMIQCCDEIGKFLGASPIVMGLTLSAVGTSFPNLWSSMLVARQGLGDMAVSNAFGSNTFNICIALGLPWFVLVVTNDFTAYDKMRDDGIVLMLSILVVVLVVFYIVIMIYDWQIRQWMAYYYIATYVTIMIYAVING